MAVPVRAIEGPKVSGDLGELRAMPVHKPCCFVSCQEPGITAIGDEDLCCDHFVVRCYEFLEQIDAERAANNSTPTYTTALKRSVNSCLQGALEVSLKSAALSNLQKARLLDIMLWAGEFVHQGDTHLAPGHGIFPARLGLAPAEPSVKEPQLKTRTTLLPQ